METAEAVDKTTIRRELKKMDSDIRHLQDTRRKFISKNYHLFAVAKVGDLVCSDGPMHRGLICKIDRISPSRGNFESLDPDYYFTNGLDTSDGQIRIVSVGQYMANEE